MGFLKAAFATTLNIILNALTLGRFLLLEGRVRRGIFKNWALAFRYRPKRFCEPISEKEIVELVRGTEHVRAFGSGHSFNAGVVVDGTLISLDKYKSIVPEDGDGSAYPRTLTFRAGTRVRDLIEELRERDLAFEALPSHDAQSIGGILSSDVHGTGSHWGWVSDMVTKLKIVDGTGAVFECEPTDDRFKAAIGGVGAIGLIIEVTVKAVPRFNVRQIFRIVPLAKVQENFELLMAEYRHLSLYIFPFTSKCQISIWEPVIEPVASKTLLGPLWEWIAISFDALAAAWIAGLAAKLRLLPLPGLSTLLHSIKRGTNLVLESDQAFNRSIYHLHQELEFTVPFEVTFERCRELIELYEETYKELGLPYGFLEVRFTPAGHDRTLIGAGRDRASTWIDLIINDEPGFEKFYERAEDLIQKIGARPHLGKFCEKLDAKHLERVHGDHFARFRALVAVHDPQGKFANPFTRRLFG